MSEKSVKRPIRVTDSEVVAGYMVYNELCDRGDYSDTADEIIKKMYKKPMRVIWRAMSRAHNRGFIEFGVSLRTGWPTKKGIAMFIDEKGAL